MVTEKDSPELGTTYSVADEFATISRNATGYIFFFTIDHLLVAAMMGCTDPE